jgi:hypothetical protein
MTSYNTTNTNSAESRGAEDGVDFRIQEISGGRGFGRLRERVFPPQTAEQQAQRRSNQQQAQLLASATISSPPPADFGAVGDVALTVADVALDVATEPGILEIVLPAIGDGLSAAGGAAVELGGAALEGAGQLAAGALEVAGGVLGSLFD